MTFDREDHLCMIQRCADEYHKLNKWEDQFIASIYERLTYHSNPLSEKQEVTLLEVYEKVTGHYYQYLEPGII